MSEGDLDLSGFGAAPERRVDVSPPKKSTKKQPKKQPKGGEAGARGASAAAANASSAKAAPRAPTPAEGASAAKAARRAPTPAEAPSGRKRRVNVSLPVELSLRFTEAADREDRYLTDMVLDAYREHFAGIREEILAQRGDLEIPFRPRRHKMVSGRVTHMLYLAGPEVAVLDASAVEVGLTRSELIARLLDRDLG